MTRCETITTGGLECSPAGLLAKSSIWRTIPSSFGWLDCHSDRLACRVGVGFANAQEGATAARESSKDTEFENLKAQHIETHAVMFVDIPGM
jgi:hypothetical protein